MIEDQIRTVMEYLKDKRVVILTHKSADIDALSSCFLFQKVLAEKIELKASDLYLSKISKTSRQFMERFRSYFSDFSFDYEITLNSNNYDVAVIIDTNNLNQVDGISTIDNSNKLEVIFIDHHAELEEKTVLNKKSLNIIDDDYPSATEIIYKIAQLYDVEFNAPFGFLAISGIVTDSGYFKFANNETIHTCSKLLNNEFSISDVYSLLDFEEDISQKIAKIKALQRLSLIRYNQFLLGISHIGSFEGLVASDLIKNGLDVVLVYSKKSQTTFRITSRADRPICEKTNLHLGKLLNRFSKKYQAHGGGHDGAASMNIEEVSEKEIEQILNMLIQEIKEILNKNPKLS